MGHPVPPGPPVEYTEDDCLCYPAGKNPAYYRFNVLGVRKCSDDSLWTSLNTIWFAFCPVPMACAWEKITTKFYLRLDLTYPAPHACTLLRIFENITEPGTWHPILRVYLGPFTSCTKEGDKNNQLLKANCGGFDPLYPAKAVTGYGGSILWNPVV